MRKNLRDAGDDLNHTVLLLCYELVKIPPSFNHRDSFASIIRIYTFLPYIVQKKNNPIKEFCVNNSYLYHFTVYKDGRMWYGEGYTFTTKKGLPLGEPLGG